MTSASAVATVPIPAANLLLRELTPGFVSLCTPITIPVSVSAGTARSGEVVQANALVDDVFALTASEPIAKNALVERSSAGMVRPSSDDALVIGRAVTAAEKAGDRLMVALQLSNLTDTPGPGTDIGFIPPSSDAPNGVLAGEARGQVYTQLDESGTGSLRIWTFNGIPGANTGWL